MDAEIRRSRGRENVNSWLKFSSRVPGHFTLVGDEVPPAARNCSEVARVILTPETEDLI